MKIHSIILIQAVLIAAFVSPAHAQLAAQTFPDVNFKDNVVTKAELDLVETEFSRPGLLPDQPLYFLKRFAERIRLFFTFDAAEKAKLHLDFAKVRLAEAKGLVEKNKTEEADQALGEYNKELTEFESTAGRNVSLLVKESSDALEKSSIVLDLVLQKVPEQARPAIEKALNNSIEKKVRIEANETQETGKEIQANVIREKRRNTEIMEEIMKIQRTERTEKTGEKKPGICIQVITPARSPEGECREFPTPCDVPEGWETMVICPTQKPVADISIETPAEKSDETQKRGKTSEPENVVPVSSPAEIPAQVKTQLPSGSI
ncbi:MAG: hypothetical protein HYU56_05125 [Candidatus Aenigmarchaeota archaeon]|nr:hypothetical protein [Candidatus Aenigmarchaeota archaeon]